jgi:hypothetical protein
MVVAENSPGPRQRVLTEGVGLAVGTEVSQGPGNGTGGSQRVRVVGAEPVTPPPVQVVRQVVGQPDFATFEEIPGRPAGQVTQVVVGAGGGVEGEQVRQDLRPPGQLARSLSIPGSTAASIASAWAR